MKIRISMTKADSKRCRDQIKGLFVDIISEDYTGNFELVSDPKSEHFFKIVPELFECTCNTLISQEGLSEPGNFKQLAELVGKHSRGKGMCEVVGVEEAAEGSVL